jgi:hypothetical protein
MQINSQTGLQAKNFIVFFRFRDQSEASFKNLLVNSL